MPTRKEIREGIAQRLRLRILGEEERTSPDDLEGITPWSQLDDVYKRTYWLKEADEILSYLHSQGIVIKVDSELPKSKDPYYLMWTEDEIVEAGYVAVKPLIEEVTDGR